MNAETLNLIERPFGEIVDDLLTAVVGGVVNEPILFDVKSRRYALAEPAIGIRGVTGMTGQCHFQFQLEVDFTFSETDNALIWREQGTSPDDETIFYVDYLRRFSNSPLTDINVGSVTRTLTEAIARETALVYQQINQAYLQAFIDTATGKSLDLVVAILGVTRKTKEFAEALVTFFRDPGAGDGNITIPEGVLLSTAKGEATFITAQIRTLQRGQSRIDVPVRATEASKGPAGIVAAGLINTLIQPITGISRITNIDETVLGEDDESDDEFRARAKAVLHSLGKATLAALQRVVFEERAKVVEVWDPNSLDKTSDPGNVTLLVETKPGRFFSLLSSIQETRAAGVLATVLARYIFVKPRVTVKLTQGLTAAGKLKVIEDIIASLTEYIELLPADAPAIGKDMLAAIKKVKDVLEATIVDVIVRRSDLSGATPSGERVAARELLLNETGGPVADTDFGDPPTFQVVTSLDDLGTWFLVLDMEAADVSLGEA